MGWRDRATVAQNDSRSDWKARAQALPDVGQPQNKDWVDTLSEVPSKLGGFLEKSDNPKLKLMGMALSPSVQKVEGKALDYPGGITRTALAKGAGMLTDGPNPVTMKDFVSAIKGEAPGVGDYAERFGVQDKPLMTVPGTNKEITSKGLINLVGNTLTNPLTYGAAGAAGESSYKSGLKRVDQALEAKGKTPLSEVLLENGAPAGSTKSISSQAQNILDSKMAERNALYDEIRQGPTGGKVDISTMPQAQAFVDKLRKNPSLEAVADDFQSRIDQATKMPSKTIKGDYEPRPPADIGDVSDWKSEFASSLPPNYYNPQNGKLAPLPQRFADAMASDYRNKIVQAADEHQIGAGSRLDGLNDEIGTLIQAQKPLGLQVGRDTTANHFSSVDAMLTAWRPEVEALKKTADIAKGTTARTVVGKTLMSPETSDLQAGVAGSNLHSSGLLKDAPQAQPGLLSTPTNTLSGQPSKSDSTSDIMLNKTFGPNPQKDVSPMNQPQNKEEKTSKGLLDDKRNPAGSP